MHDLNIRDSFSGLSPGAFAPGTTFCVAVGRFMVMIVSRNVGRSLRETDYLLENFSIALRSSSWVLAYSSRGIPFTAASQP